MYMICVYIQAKYTQPLICCDASSIQAESILSSHCQHLAQQSSSLQQQCNELSQHQQAIQTQSQNQCMYYMQ